MLTEKQLTANRLNAQKSTGPQTVEGKARSSRNAVTHGVFTRIPCLPGEDPADYQEIPDMAYAAYPPRTAEEALLVDQLTANLRSLHRLQRIEQGLFACELAAVYREQAKACLDAACTAANEEQSATLLRRAAECEQQAEECEQPQEAILGQVFLRCCNGTDAFTKLSRYLTTCRRRVDRLLRDLHRLHAAPLAEELPNEPDAQDSGANDVLCPELGEGLGLSTILSNIMRSTKEDENPCEASGDLSELFSHTTLSQNCQTNPFPQQTETQV